MSPQESPAADPITVFLDEMEYLGKSERTRTAYQRVLRDFQGFVGPSAPDAADTPLRAVSRRDCLEWLHHLREERDIRQSTIATYAAYVNRFFGYMNKTGAFDSNPMGLVMEEMDESISTDPERREITVPEMRSFIETVQHPLEQAVILTFLKTGIRVGELCNLDLRDLHLDDREIMREFGEPPRRPLDHRPDSMYIPADVQRGQTINGEHRTASNKRKRHTVIPVDDELKRTIKRWLTIRPVARSPAEPVFVGFASRSGLRLRPHQVRSLIKRRAKPFGWYEAGAGPQENVTPHYFRHFFTTHLRNRTGDRGVVKYLRGDVASDIIDTYTHNWGEQVRETYERHIYRLHE